MRQLRSKKSLQGKRIFGIVLLAILVISGCASLEKLQKQKTGIEEAIVRAEQATRDKIAATEAEMDELIAIIDSSNSFSEDAKNNAKIAELQEKVNTVAVKGRDRVDKLAIRIQNLEHRITTKMNTKDLD